jgi:DNA-binding transcriptional ArsR family regulator
MSHDATAWARTQKTGSTSAKFILMLLADYAGTDYSCWPSVAKLAEVAEMGESTVRAATKLLAEAGLIRVFYRHRSSGLRRTSRYQLLIDGTATAEPDADDWSRQRQISAEDDRQEPAVDGADLSASVRQDLADIPIKEPSLKNEPSVVTPGAERAARATRVPENFMPDEKMRAWFLEEQLPAVIDGKREHARFMDYWLGCPGVRGKKVDWPATWRNWMREAADRAGRSGRRPGNALAPVSGAPYRPSTTDQKVAQTLELGRRLQAMEETK